MLDINFMEYELNEKQLLLNFSEKYCKTEIEILNSNCFLSVLESFLRHAHKTNNQIILQVLDLFNEDDVAKTLVDLFKHLLLFEISEIKKHDELFKKALSMQDNVYEMIQEFYDYWRKLERISLTYSKANLDSVESASFIDAQSAFNQLVLKIYRSISEKLYGDKFPIYRQLPAGINAALMLSKNRWMDKNSPYSFLEKCNAIEQILIRPPYIIHSEKNKRTGVYEETKKNPLKQIISNFDANDFYCYQAKVGSSLTYVYFHKDFLAMGIACCNLFEFVPLSKTKGVKPDCIYIMGANIKGESCFYYDKDNDIYLGVAPHNDSVDYFGYVKKMMLTLYNVKMIKNKCLPLHGACVHLTLANGKTKNIVIIGDSGAGKSESLEALSNAAGDMISQSLTVFDDMGTFKLDGDDIKAYGTEIGAFVRIDDMSSGYAYKEMDRAIFMNPERANSRLIIPVSTYPQIMKGYKVDMLLYANNYDAKSKDGIEFFSNIDDAKEVFIEGARYAKGTTQEYGLVKSFFANPFGPVQFEKETRKLIDFYFDKLYKEGVPIGVLHTKLAVPGMELDGPKCAAEALLKLLNE